jgi:hypothetical protein
MVQSSKSSKCVSFGPSRKITLNGSGNREDGGNDFSIYIVTLLTNQKLFPIHACVPIGLVIRAPNRKDNICSSPV